MNKNLLDQLKNSNVVYIMPIKKTNGYIFYSVYTYKFSDKVINLLFPFPCKSGYKYGDDLPWFMQENKQFDNNNMPLYYFKIPRGGKETELLLKESLMQINNKLEFYIIDGNYISIV